MSQSKLLDLTGQKFGQFVVVRHAGMRKTPNGTKRTLWLCRCRCRKLVKVGSNDLRRKDGKAIRACASCANRKHGHTRKGWQSPTYRSWRSMLLRCERSTDYAGIAVCKRWRLFKNFLADMGTRPKGRTIDRKNNLRGYTPGNCRWATAAQQTRNTKANVRIIINGKTKVLHDWLVVYSISSGAYYWRIKHGMSSVAALTTPLKS